MTDPKRSVYGGVEQAIVDDHTILVLAEGGSVTVADVRALAWAARVAKRGCDEMVGAGCNRNLLNRLRVLLGGAVEPFDGIGEEVVDVT